MYEAAIEDLTRLWLPALAANAAVAFGAAVQGAVGFGMALLAAPLLVLIRPELVPGPLLINGLALTLLVARRERDSIDLFGVKWALVGRVPGVALGALALATVPVAGDVAAGGARGAGGCRTRLRAGEALAGSAGSCSAPGCSRACSARSPRSAARRSPSSTSTSPGRSCAARSPATSSSER